MRIGILNLLVAFIVVGAIGFVAGLLVEWKNKWITKILGR